MNDPTSRLDRTRMPRYAPDGEAPSRVFVSAGSGGAGIRQGFTQDELLTAARSAMGGMDPTEVTWLTAYDSYYYDRTGGRHLPALRAKFDDADGTWLYLDSTDGSIALAEVRGSRAERWLYQGLHSLDFPGLYQSRWAWYPHHRPQPRRCGAQPDLARDRMAGLTRKGMALRTASPRQRPAISVTA